MNQAKPIVLSLLFVFPTPLNQQVVLGVVANEVYERSCRKRGLWQNISILDTKVQRPEMADRVVLFLSEALEGI